MFVFVLLKEQLYFWDYRLYSFTAYSSNREIPSDTQISIWTKVFI